MGEREAGKEREGESWEEQGLPHLKIERHAQRHILNFQSPHEINLMINHIKQ